MRGTAGVFRKLALSSPGRALLVFATNTVYWTLPLFAGLVIRVFLDGLSGGAAVGWSLWTLAALYLSVSAGRGFWWVGAGALSEYHLGVAAYLLRRNLLSLVLRKASFRIPVSTGEFMNRFQHDAVAASAPVFYATVGSGQVVSAAATLCVLLSINLSLTIIVFLAPLLTFAILRVLGPSIQKAHLGERESSERASGFLTELLGNVQALQVAGAESAAVARYERLNELRRRATTRSALVHTTAAALNTAVVGVAVGLILLVAALGPARLTIGELGLFATYVGFGDGVVVEIADWVANLMRSLRQGRVSVSRLKELVSVEDHASLADTSFPSLRRHAPSVEPTATPEDVLEVLTFTDVSGGGIGTELSIRPGEIVVITGRVGSGKTYLLESLLGLAGETAREIRWNGRRVEHPAAAWFVPPRSAYVPQAPRVFSETVRENILLGHAADDRALERAIRMAVLEEDVARLERGVDTPVGARGVKLSGGQAQRVAAARAFLRRPQLLVLDDLSSALDVETERTLWDRLFSEGGGPACLVVSHRRAVLERADRVVLMRHGRIDDHGALQEVLERSAEMRRIWKSG